MTDRIPLPPECPEGCWCRWLDDPDWDECACDGPCGTEAWDALPDGTPRPDFGALTKEIDRD